MANKKTLGDIDAEMTRWLRRLNMATRKLMELDQLRRKILAGKVKMPKVRPEDLPSTKVELFPKRGTHHPDLNDELPDDLRPVGFGSGAAIGAG